MRSLGPAVNESTNAHGPPAGRAVRDECLRAAASLAVAPLRAGLYLARQRTLRRATRDDLEHPAEVDPGPDAQPFARPLRVFVSAAEHSGETHACNLVRALRTEVRGELELSGLGGARLAALGVKTVGDPVARAAMGADAVRSLSFYVRLMKTAAAHLCATRPDVCVAVDSPALHVPLGGIAHRYGVPVVHFVTPQYWGWAPWRVDGYRRAVDLALTILPFEPPWFARHGVRSAHVGHPQLDVLPDPPGAGAERTTLVLLPGSREKVIARNLPWMLVAAARMRLALPDVEVVLPHDRPETRGLLEHHVNAAGASGWLRIAVGDVHRELARARVALSVSGTILIDLLHHRIPCAVIYRVGSRLSEALSRRVLTVPWFASINLLAGRTVVPEFCFHGAGPVDEVGTFLARCWTEEGLRAEIRAGLDLAARRLGPPGAVRRAARHALAAAMNPAPSPA